MRKWYQGEGNNADVVLYSGIRLSRNLADTPFPSRMSNDIRKNISKKIYAAVKSSPMAGDFDMINLAELTDAQAASYAEKRLISRDFLKLKSKASFMLSKQEDLSVMLCEEDHIQITAYAAGESLQEAYQKADKLDDIFISTLKLAYSERLGFLTASPINLGTGMHASFVLHLPALKQAGALYRLSSMVSKLGLSLREMFRHGTGDLYVLANQVTLGISEQNAMDNITAICDQIVKQERAEREAMKDGYDFEDKIYRALGILQSARRLESKEFLEVLSRVRLGAALGYLTIDYKTIGDLLYTLQNASLVASSDKELTKEECAKLRAQIIREKLETMQ